MGLGYSYSSSRPRQSKLIGIEIAFSAVCVLKEEHKFRLGISSAGENSSDGKYTEGPRAEAGAASAASSLGKMDP